MLDVDHRQRLLVYRVSAHTISRQRNYAPSIVRIIQTPHLLPPIGVVRSFYSRGFKVYPSGHIIYRDDRHHLLNLIFQNEPVIVENFNIGPFHFQLVEEQPHLDVYTYHTSKDYFCILVIVFGTDTSSYYGPHSNVDFEHFIWKNFEQFGLKKICHDPTSF